MQADQIYYNIMHTRNIILNAIQFIMADQPNSDKHKISLLMVSPWRPCYQNYRLLPRSLGVYHDHSLFFFGYICIIIPEPIIYLSFDDFVTSSLLLQVFPESQEGEFQASRPSQRVMKENSWSPGLPRQSGRRIPGRDRGILLTIPPDTAHNNNIRLFRVMAQTKHHLSLVLLYFVLQQDSLVLTK